MPVHLVPDGNDEDYREIIRQRNEWFYSLSTPYKQEKLFELELLLKALDRFFNVSNQPLSDRNNLVSRDFQNELVMVRNAVTRVVKLTQGLLSDEDTRALQFRSYVENRLMNDYQRARRIERALLQRTPEESLYVLCKAFINFQAVLQAVAGQGHGSYFLFYHLEQLISREITGNRFFNPFRAAGFAPHYDVIKNRDLIRVVRNIEDPVLRKHLSVIFLMLFKLLHYFAYVDPEKKRLEELKDSLLIFALVHSEVTLLIELLEGELPGVIKGRENLEPEKKEALLDHFESLVFQLRMEFRKIYDFELKEAARVQEITPLRVGVSRSKGILTNIFKQAVVYIIQVFEPGFKGKDVFPDFISRLEESLKLRKDIWLFHKVLENAENAIEASGYQGDTVPVIEAVKTLRNFIFYYQNISFQFVRCYDREEFQRFFDEVDGFDMSAVHDPARLQDFQRKLHAFKMFLETTLANVNNRAELREVPFGTDEGEKLLSQFLA
ncbi:MAG: hypothetical protein R6V10_04685 [bacterium]